MITRLLISAAVMAVGWVVLFATHRRFGGDARAVRNFAILLLTGLIASAVVAFSSNDYVVRCRGNPSEYCTYNDGVPAMATVTGVYLIAVLFKAWRLYDHR